MRALVVFESMFGNTEEVARAVADGLGPYLDTETMEVGSAPVEVGSEVSLVVVGGPTHAFGMTRPASRKTAEQQSSGPLVSTGIGIREWIQHLHADPHRTTFATFGTKVRLPLPGSAAKSADRVLRARGFRIVRRPMSFWVDGTPGPLRTGETGRARRWGAELGAVTNPRGAVPDHKAGS